MTFEQGHVVPLRRNGVGLVWRVDGSDVWIVPIWSTNGPPRHRAEVHIENLGDIVACGLSIRNPVARCHMAFKLTQSQLAKREPHGVAPSSLMIRVMAAIMREVASQVLEARFQLARPQSRIPMMVMA